MAVFQMLSDEKGSRKRSRHGVLAAASKLKQSAMCPDIFTAYKLITATLPGWLRAWLAVAAWLAACLAAGWVAGWLAT